MELLAQIGSIDYDGNGGRKESGEYMFGDLGIVYLFYCKGCGKTHSLTQFF